MPHVGGFRRESGAGVEGANNGFNRSSSLRAPLDVQTSLGKAHRKSVGPENRGEGVSNTFKDIGAEQQGLRGESTKSFCRAGPLGCLLATQAACSTKRLERFDEESAASPKRYPGRATTTKITSSAIQAEAKPRGPPDPDGGGGIPTNKEYHRRGGDYEPMFLQQFILQSKEDGRDKTYIGSKETELVSRGKKLQDRVPEINLQDNQKKRFYDVPGFQGRILAYPNQEFDQKMLALLFRWTKLPVPCSTAQISLSPHTFTKILRPVLNWKQIQKIRVYKFEACRAGILYKQVQIRVDPLSENHTPWYDYRQQGDVLESSKIKAPRPKMRSRKIDKCWEHVAQMLSELYCKDKSDDGSAIKVKINAAPTAGEEEQILVEECFMDIDGASTGRKNSESTILEGPFEESEWSVVPAGNPRNRNIHRCERYCLGRLHWPQELLWFISKTGECNEPFKDNDRMVTFEQDILSIGKEVREAQLEPLCISYIQEDTKILQLVPGPSIYRPERAAVQLGRTEEPLLLPSLELDCTGSPEYEMRADNNDCTYTRMDIFDFVPGNVSTFDLAATNSSSNRGNPRSEKRKVPALQEQRLDYYGMENQLSALKEKKCLQHCN
ncbi:hypothetical protein AYI68_g7594 [Smittium mucronatum]|uniref:Uncharacterized protein n=1 Tax=Smittium mucronatum TaxID=133383 RepID=A0A1R0GNA3_9FUNG|nr:hypothetical protein AYI68_g7594 [Smittium mucronatum]